MSGLLLAGLIAQLQSPNPAARMTQTGTAQTVGNTTNTLCTLNTVDYDTSGTAIADTTNNRMIINRTGLWTVSIGMRFQSNASTAERAIAVWRNNVNTDRVCGANGYGSYQVLSATSTVRLCTGDMLYFYLWQATGGNLNVDLSLEPCQMSAVWVGPA